MKIAFLGDISFNDEYNELYRKEQKPFEGITDELKAYDYVIGNLECLSEGTKGENELKWPRLKTKTQTLNYLNHLNISAVSLAHNHVFDNLSDGFQKTISFLESNSIRHFGAGFSSHEAGKPLLIEKEGKKVCVLSYVHEDTNSKLPEDCPLFVNIYNADTIIKEVARYRQQDYFVILYLHWGGKFEGGMYPDLYQSQDARRFINKGVELIVGHHTHTLQPFEIIKGKYVFYSLGNFCFANLNLKGKVRKLLKLPRNTESMIVTIEIKNKIRIKTVPVKNRKHYIEPSKNVLYKIKIRNFLFALFFRNKLMHKIYAISFFKVYPYLKMLRFFEDISYIRKMRALVKSGK